MRESESTQEKPDSHVPFAAIFPTLEVLEHPPIVPCRFRIRHGASASSLDSVKRKGAIAIWHTLPYVKACLDAQTRLAFGVIRLRLALGSLPERVRRQCALWNFNDRLHRGPKAFPRLRAFNHFRVWLHASRMTRVTPIMES